MRNDIVDGSSKKAPQDLPSDWDHAPRRSSRSVLFGILTGPIEDLGSSLGVGPLEARREVDIIVWHV